MTYSSQYVMKLAFFLLTALLFALPALASDVNDVAENMVTSVNRTPALVSAFAYLLALIFATTGVLKLKEHVTNPTQTPLRTPIIRFLIGGALLALPIITQAMSNAINGGNINEFDPSGTLGSIVSNILGIVGSIPIQNNLNNIFANIIDSIEKTPALISATAYLLGLIAAVSGLLKIKEHVENPEQTPMREGVIRLLAGGALFELPTIYNAMFDLVGSADPVGMFTSITSAVSMFYSSYAIGVCNPLAGFGGGILTGGGVTLGDAICGIFLNAGAFSAFLTAIGYLIGLILGLWGILKIKAHVLNPQQTPIWEGVSRLVAGGMFFALPVMIEVIKNTLVPVTSSTAAIAIQVTGYNETAVTCDGSGGLDGALYCMMKDTLAPMHIVINFFANVAGVILLMIAISRLMKTSQDGARAPNGLGTFMTFIAAGALLSYNAIMRMVTSTMSLGLGGFVTATRGTMLYTQGMTNAEAQHVHTIISAIIKFMIVVGLISFIRGIFIIRSVAEGNGQASLMAGVTHMVGGALAVNLGPLINLVQSTLGISTYGIAFI